MTELLVFPDALLQGLGVGLAIVIGIAGLALGAAFLRRLSGF